VPAITVLPQKSITFYAVSNALALDYSQTGKRNAKNIVGNGYLFTYSVVITEDEKFVYEYVTN
jgi:hypothetical protein